MKQHEEAPPAFRGSLDVVSWRMDRLVEAGYPVLTALRLAEHPDVDLHRACELLERGATLGEALRILL